MSAKDGIRKRLDEYINGRYGSISGMSNSTGIPASTLTGNSGKNRPRSVPGSELLLKLKLLDPDLDLNYIIAGIKKNEQISQKSEFTKLAKALLQSQTELLTTLQNIHPK